MAYNRDKIYQQARISFGQSSKTNGAGIREVNIRVTKRITVPQTQTQE